MSDIWTDRLSESVDGTLDAGEQARLAEHLKDCAACRATLAELERVVSRARALDDRPPATDLWPGIAERIGVTPDVVRLESRRKARRLSFSVPQLMAAGIALLLIGSAAAWLALGSRNRQTIASPVAAGSAGPVALANWVDPAIAASDSDVVELRAALGAGRRTGRIDSSTVRVLESSLATIDSAVAQAHRALAGDPNSAYLNQYLAKTLRRKSEFVRRAGTLVSTRMTLRS